MFIKFSFGEIRFRLSNQYIQFKHKKKQQENLLPYILNHN